MNNQAAAAATAGPACTQVLETQELLEMILLRVTVRQTVLTCTRVCQRWLRTINTSPAIKAKLFTKPLPFALEDPPRNAIRRELLLFGMSTTKHHAWDLRRFSLPGGLVCFLFLERGKEMWVFKYPQDVEGEWVWMKGPVGKGRMKLLKQKEEEAEVEWRMPDGTWVADCVVPKRGHPLSEYLERWYFTSMNL